ncbi:MAG: bifunctional phosphopantothenoylcysteine decarboxylase/phosphopantothenate--cysteine ligase CoaBC [Bacteroidota bacterium]
MLAGKNILLGVSGGIAAYQAVDLIGLLRSRLADVRVIMTTSATQFITPLTLETVSQHPVSVEMFDGHSHSSIEHIALGRIADIVVLAPATANLIGKIANGIADDMLTTTIMAVRAPVIICPAMNENMWLNPIVQENVAKLKRNGYLFVDPEYGEMACGGEGWGRLARLDKIVAAVLSVVTDSAEAQERVGGTESIAERK